MMRGAKMGTGKNRRLNRIFRADNQTVIVPMDHGVTLGPVIGLSNMQNIVDKLALGEADAIIVHKGIARNIDNHKMGLIVHLSASTELSPDPYWKVRVCSVEQAIKLGADAVSIHINIGATNENEMLTFMGRVSDKCAIYEIPLLAMIYPRGLGITNCNDVKLVKHVAKGGAELGADIIKTNYTGSVETFIEVIESCPVPIVIAGGPKMNTDEEVLTMVYDSIQAGGVGASIGRNVFQHRDPSAMTKAISAIVHKDATVEEALEIIGDH
jgi:fructose-bisphosphate aldolase/2-amino-3,7-dideoxy-D-threo-hept-6-ulosonate synthase